MKREEILSHIEEFGLYYICRDLELSEDFIEKHENKINSYWWAISRYQKLSEKFIEKHKNEIDWIELSLNKKIKLSDKLTLKYKLLGYIK